VGLRGDGRAGEVFGFKIGANVSGRPRRVSTTGYWEWVLGDLRPKSLLHVQTEVDLKSGALLARNYYNTEFPDRIAFVDVNDVTRTLTGDRKEFSGQKRKSVAPGGAKNAHAFPAKSVRDSIPAVPCRWRSI